MAPRNTPRFTLVFISIIVLLTVVFQPTQFASAADLVAVSPDLTSFSLSVQNGQAGVVRGVYVDKALAFPVIQQPSYNGNYVSDRDGVVTEFNAARSNGNVGLLAHNTLAGKFFFNLKVGQTVTLVYGDGKTESFVISQIVRYAALSPFSATSDFKNLDTNTTVSASQLFSAVYTGSRHVTFQTCIESNGNPSWGRLFVIAQPIK